MHTTLSTSSTLYTSNTLDTPNTLDALDTLNAPKSVDAPNAVKAVNTLDTSAVFLWSPIAHGNPPGQYLGNVIIFCSAALSPFLLANLDRPQAVGLVLYCGQQILTQVH